MAESEHWFSSLSFFLVKIAGNHQGMGTIPVAKGTKLKELVLYEKLDMLTPRKENQFMLSFEIPTDQKYFRGNTEF